MLALACTAVAGAAPAVRASACSGTAASGVDRALSGYEPRALELPPDASYVGTDGRVVVVGYNDMHDLLEVMASRFSAAHPHVRFRLDLPGTRHAPVPLAKGLSAFAPMGALFTPVQLEEYRRTTGSDPLAIRIAHASLDPKALSGPLAVFVHRGNPLRSLTLAQLARVFAGEAQRWRDLGVDSGIGTQAIHLYGTSSDTPLALEFRQAVLPDRGFGPGFAGVPQSVEVVQRIASDASGIGFAAAMRATPEVRALAIAPDNGSRPVAPTCEDVVAGRYPLDRHLFIYVRRPVTPLAREFVRFALSREGQQAVAASPQRYLPLSAREAAAERVKLE
jgi:phosphate transport system substrate-binding protein